MVNPVQINVSARKTSRAWISGRRRARISCGYAPPHVPLALTQLFAHDVVLGDLWGSLSSQLAPASSGCRVDLRSANCGHGIGGHHPAVTQVTIDERVHPGFLAYAQMRALIPVYGGLVPVLPERQCLFRWHQLVAAPGENVTPVPGHARGPVEW